MLRAPSATAIRVRLGTTRQPRDAGDVSLGGEAIDLVAAWEHTCALLKSGAIRCWGAGADGRLGYGNTQDVGDDETPASVGDVPLGGPAVALSAGGASTCAVLATGQVRCWGLNTTGTLGTGDFQTIGDDETPTTTPALTVF